MRFAGRLRRGKRGVGSIIGAVFIVLIILSAFTFYSLTLDTTAHYDETASSMSEVDWNRSQEKLEIKNVEITDTDKLSLTVENTGSISTHLIQLGIFNISTTPESQSYYALNENIEPAETKSITSDFSIVQGKTYVIQLVTELGNTVEYRFYPANEVYCALTLITASPTAYQGNNVTVLLTVTNNDTEVDTIQNLTVSLEAYPPELVAVKEQPSSLSIESLKSGENAFFRWVYTAISTGTVTFNASYAQAPAGIYTLATVEIMRSSEQQGAITVEGEDCTVEYNPLQWDALGATEYVSGSISDLANDDANYAVFRSYQSASSSQSLYAHSETITIGGTPYFLQKIASGDGTATSLSASMGTAGRQLWGKFVYPLTSVTTIPSSMWTMYYRGWQDASPAIAFDSASSVEASTMASYASWFHTTTAASNRLLIVTVNVYAATGTPTTVTSATYGGVALTQVTADLNSAADPQVRTYTFRLVNPASGTNTIAVTFASSTLYVCGATTYANVDQTTPIQTSQTATGSSTSPSVAVTATGTGRAVFGTLAGYRTAETVAQVTYVGAGAGSGTSMGNPTPSYLSGLQANDLILLQVSVGNSYSTPTPPDDFTLLYGPDSTGTGRQWIYYKFSDGTEPDFIAITIGGYSANMARMYAFRNVALSSFTEGGDFGSGVGSTIYARSVTTTGDKRLAVSFVFMNDDNSVDEFAGETGGDWQEAAEYLYSGPYYNDDGCIQLQTATMASAGTISGGSYNMGASDRWGVRAFALKPNTAPQPWIITEGSGQNNRWAAETNQYKGKGSDKLNVAAGTVTMSWSTDLAPNWVCSAMVINPVAPTGHCDIDILIRRSDGSVRATIASNVATSSDLTSTATTLSGTYAWDTYTVVDQTDYLEVDYYVNVTTATAGVNAYLRIDDPALAIGDQTRVTNVMLPNEYAAEVEFTGSSNLLNWTQILWQIDSTWNVGQVTVTVQFFNFTLGDFAASGDGYLSYVSSATPNTNETMSQAITLSSDDFRNSTGYWRVKITGVKSAITQFQMSIDWINLQTTCSTTGESIPCDTWQRYMIKATTADGAPIPYASVSIYANSTNVVFRNAVTEVSLENPCWVYLNADGEYYLEIKSAHTSSEIFVLYAVVGSVVGQMAITQEAPA